MAIAEGGIMRIAFTAFLSLAAMLTSAVRAADAAWQNVSDPTVQKLTDAGVKLPWPGETAGVAVDPSTGDVFMIVTGQGVWKSSDRGKTFARCDDGEVGGRCETSYSINADPDGGGRLAFFMLDGKCALTLDGGKTWQAMKDVGRNWDYAAVDWAGGARHIFAMRHESGGEIYLSHDAGKSWKMIGKDAKFGACGIFGENVLVTTKGSGILRSTDGGENWAPAAGDFTPIGRVVKIFQGTAYWIAKEGIITSKDQGATWTLVGKPAPEASLGPWFKDSKHFVVAGKKGIFETLDAGETWTAVAPLPEKFDVPQPGWFSNVAWDPKGDVFYASRMSKPTFRWERRAGP
jgi:photosystem II stability/assembly factor-like uncharacterized protein